MATLDVSSSLGLLKKYGIPVLEGRIVSEECEAVKAATKAGYPVVMKIVSEKTELSHKTDVGGVLLNIKNEEGVKEAFSKLSKIADKVLVQKQHSGTEVIIGVKVDSTFGPVVMFGLGGIFTELMKDVSFRICPIEPGEAEDMIHEIKSGKILTGYRGKPPANVSALKDILVKVSKLAMKEKDLKELDMNPVIVNEKDAIAIDARVITSS